MAQIIQEMLTSGAVIIDVRTPAEFQGGNVAGSLNYPLQDIQGKVDDLKQLGKPLVLCCAKGIRSGMAAAFLKTQGISCENGGGWLEVNALV
ncbi:MAG: rhodanese-related sulfurtransferase [Flavobacteriales bacterium]|jgi:phage shock protein E